MSDQTTCGSCGLVIGHRVGCPYEAPFAPNQTGWTEAHRWPPFTHGRIVCRNCKAVVAQCRCPQGCEVVGTVETCKQCRVPAVTGAEHEEVSGVQNRKVASNRESGGEVVPHARPQLESAADLCQGCGGRYVFDTSVPSVVWNQIIRAQGLPEYLCTTCIVKAFALAGRSFTATLWSEAFNGLPLEVRINNQVARDADDVSNENTALRNQVDALTRDFAALQIERDEFKAMRCTHYGGAEFSFKTERERADKAEAARVQAEQERDELKGDLHYWMKRVRMSDLSKDDRERIGKGLMT